MMQWNFSNLERPFHIIKIANDDWTGTDDAVNIEKKRSFAVQRQFRYEIFPALEFISVSWTTRAKRAKRKLSINMNM